MENLLNTFSTQFEENKASILSDYTEFLRFQSISADPAKRKELLSCSLWIQKKLEALGFSTTLWNKEDAPVVFAEPQEFRKELPTLLIYNHYDVQPVSPENLWDTDPFTAVEKDGNIFARGAQDNKGQCWYILSALSSYKKIYGSFPINIKFCIEGEEESGSSFLKEHIQEYAEDLKADYLLVCDLYMQDIHTPAITLGLRGIIGLSLAVETMPEDVHSGTHGGAVVNPIQVLTKLLHSLYKEDGSIAIPGFYDTVALPTDEELQSIIPLSQEALISRYSVLPFGGEKKYPPQARVAFRPALEINGISGGYSGPNLKTVIPAKAEAKLSCRLVPNQIPEEVGLLIKNYVEQQAPPGAKVTCTVPEGGGRPLREKRGGVFLNLLDKACQAVYNKECVYIYEGASVPIIADLQQVVQKETALFGLGLPSDRIHAPNEHFSIDRFKKGYIIISLLLEGLRSKHIL